MLDYLRSAGVNVEWVEKHGISDAELAALAEGIKELLKREDSK